MGHGVSCARTGDEHDYFRAAQLGDLDALDALLAADPSLVRRATLYDRLSALHIAAANGRLEVLAPRLLRATAAMDPLVFILLLFLSAGAVHDLGSRGAARRRESAEAGAGSDQNDVFSLSFCNLQQRSLYWPLKNLTFFFSPYLPVLQTPLMLAAMHGKIDCVLKLLQAGANVSKPA
jgi:ankyrin repeat protein